jgi:transcriptional regulator with XRE-family HTH domain
MDDPDALGILIRSARNAKGLTLAQLAAVVGQSSSTVRRWERGEDTPTVDVLPGLADALDLDEAELASMVDATDVSPPAAIATTGVEVEAPRARTTLEDEEVVVEVANYFETTVPAVVPPPPPQPSRFGRISSAVWGRRDSWIGWVRGFLTALALVFLFMGLVWAFGELMTALKEVLGSFSTGG